MEETYEDIFFSRFIFVRALGALLPEGKGVFLVFSDEESPFKRVIVHNTDNVIGVLDAEERTDLKHGDWVVLISEDLIKN
jgi:hypothetical protein